MLAASIFEFGTGILAQAAIDPAGVPWRLVGGLIASIVLLLVLILVVRLQAFVSLLLASIFLAIVSGMELRSISDSIIDGMGGALGFVATIIGLGAIFGQILEHSGGAQSLARSMIRTFGVERGGTAMMVTGFLISIPVFFDVALVILAPLLYALARDTKKNLLIFGLPLIAGMGVTHAFIPPTPGPIIVAENIGADLGWVIFWGALIGFPTAIVAGPLFTRFIVKHVDVPVPAHAAAELEVAEQKAGGQLPSFWLVFLMIGLPILLILASTGTKMAGTALTQELHDELKEVRQDITANEDDLNDFGTGEDPAFVGNAYFIVQTLRQEEAQLEEAISEAMNDRIPGYDVIQFVGHPVTALILATLLALYILGVRRGASGSELLAISTAALGPAGIIILVTGAGGVFKQILVDSGVGEALAKSLSGLDISVIVLAYLFAVIVRVTQGSATVAMIAGSSLIAPVISPMDLSAPQLGLLTIAIAAGATTASHVNDSGFWMVSRYFGMNEATTIKTWTVVSIIISALGFSLAAIAWQFV